MPIQHDRHYTEGKSNLLINSESGIDPTKEESGLIVTEDMEQSVEIEDWKDLY